MTNLFYFFSREDAPFFFPGAPFMMGALLILLGLLIAIPALSRLK